MPDRAVWAGAGGRDLARGTHQVGWDPILVPLGFAAGQAGASSGEGQVIFCCGDVDSTDGGCIDLVVDLEATP